MNAYRRFLVVFGSTALGGILAIGALNLFIDPYDRFGFNRLGTFISADREYKSTEMVRFKPEAVLMGNSRAAIINVGKLGEPGFFNAAFAGASAEEMEFFIDRYMHTQKLVVLSLDMFSFGPLKEAVSNPFQPMTIRRTLEYTLSMKSTEYSVRTLTSALAGLPRDYSPDGTFREGNWAANADSADDETVHRKEQELADEWAAYKFDPARMQAMRDIRRTLEQRGIPLLVYLPPIDARVWQKVKGTTGYEEMLRTRTAIEEIFPETVDLTESEYSAPEGFFRNDPMHFRSAVGERLLRERVLKKKPMAARKSGGDFSRSTAD